CSFFHGTNGVSLTALPSSPLAMNSIGERTPTIHIPPISFHRHLDSSQSVDQSPLLPLTAGRRSRLQEGNDLRLGYAYSFRRWPNLSLWRILGIMTERKIMVMGAPNRPIGIARPVYFRPWRSPALD